MATSLSVSAANLTWTGAVNGNWDTTTLNWLNGSSASAFHTGDNVTFDNSAISPIVTIPVAVAPASVLVNNSGGNYSISGAGFGGNGGLTKNGTSMLTLSSVDTYTGATLINSGTVALTGSGSISSSLAIALASGTLLDASSRSDGTLHLAGGQTLAGIGSVHGVVIAAPGSVIAPGTSSTGTLTLNSNLTLSGDVLVKLNGTTLQNDLITGINTLTYGGTLTVSNLGSALAAGEFFTLFSASSSSSNFTSIVGSPGPGLAYSFNPATGVLGITNAAPGPSANLWLNTLNGSTVTVHFDDVLQPASATNTDNYTIYAKSFSAVTVTITNAVLQSDQQTVALYLSAPAGEFFAVAATNIVDTASNKIAATATGYTNYTTTASIGSSNDPAPPGEAIPIFNDTFAVTANGSDIGGTNDHCQLVYQPVVGNFEVAVQVTRLDNTSSAAKAGLMAREDLSPGSPSLGVYFTPLTSGGTLPTNQILTVFRSGTNGSANSIATPVATSSLNWLRMTRTNNVLTVYYGSNGVSWTACGNVIQPFKNIMLIGVAATSNTNGVNTMAGFSSFGAAGSRPGDAVVPTLTASIFQKTNLVVNWQRTPHDFAVQICTNLLQDTNSSSGSNGVPQWGFVMLPTFDTSLTGTNSATPPSGRYMTIPMNLFPGSPMFVRLAQVDRVIPDPLVVTAGFVFSLANSNLVKNAASGATLCSDNVDTASLLTQNGTSIICPAGHTYQFTTANSGSTLHTALQTRNLKTLATTCDGIFSAGNYKSQITFTNAVASTATNFTFVAGATPSPAATVTSPVVVTVNIIH
ncbi:MAG TPA: autotransporter-associated beta strand repeat-containing protein [Verrucomicrobiae bacterium]|nr:autotransporter-associated beta strand repeat-containing protein [Verrucomicrobiae bacterium]